MKSIINKVFKSYHTIIITLGILCFISLLYNNKILNNQKLYIFDGKSEYVDIKSGVISLSLDVNLFEGSNIEYLKKDVNVTRYDIGYYVKTDKEYLPLATIAGEDDEGLSLKMLIEGTNAFRVIEFNKNNYYFTKEKLKKLDDDLYFIIKATDKKNNEITDVIRLNKSKVSR